MKNVLFKLWNNFLTYKKITIPVTIVVAGLVIGGAGYGISASDKKASAPKEAKTKTEKVVTAEVKDDVSVEDTSGNDAKEEKTLTNEQTDNRQANAKKDTSTAVKNTAGGGSDASANAGSTTTSTNNGSTTTPSTNNSEFPVKPEYVTCTVCDINYLSGTNHKCRTCSLCGEYHPLGRYTNCPYTKDAYGNVVRKDSRYVVAVGNYDIKKMSDGTYDVPQSARDKLASSYECEKLIYGDDWVNNPRLTSIDAWCISCSAI